MAIDLSDYETKTREAIQAFWGNRELARKKQQEAGTLDQGERADVTAGKNMDGFIALVIDLIRANGLSHMPTSISDASCLPCRASSVRPNSGTFWCSIKGT
jgi:hypothetical protein